MLSETENQQEITSHLPNRGEVRVGSLCETPALLRELGVSPERVMAPFGLSESFLKNPDNTILFSVFGAYLNACARFSACPHFGLLAGQRRDVTALGAIGVLAKNSQDVETALNELVRNFALHNRAATLSLKESAANIVVCFDVVDPTTEGVDHIFDGAMAILFNFFKGTCGLHWAPVEVWLSRHKPEGEMFYQRFFGAPIRFGMEQTALLIRSDSLKTKIVDSDAYLRHHFQRHVEQLRILSNEDFQARAYRLLVCLLEVNECSLDNLARKFSIHPRTLNRRLKDSGTNYRELHNRARHDAARQALRQTNQSIDAIAAHLGYSAVSAFSRAFTLWEGATPSDWRNANKKTYY